MDERNLLLLGILKAQSQHGYQINEFIEKNLSHVTDMKKSTAYTLLDRLSDAGLVSMQQDQEGNRPPRKVYSITQAGENEFNALLKGILSKSDRLLFPGDIGLMFMDHLPISETVSCLEERLEQVDEQLQAHESAPGHGFGVGVDLAMAHHIAILRAESEWLHQVVERLKSGDISYEG
jgi:DNA-binding PadR family transcriptional regulator